MNRRAVWPLLLVLLTACQPGTLIPGLAPGLTPPAPGAVTAAGESVRFFSGRAVLPDGRPLADAEVIVTRLDGTILYQGLKTDQYGRFVAPVPLALQPPGGMRTQSAVAGAPGIATLVKVKGTSQGPVPQKQTLPQPSGPASPAPQPPQKTTSPQPSGTTPPPLPPKQTPPPPQKQTLPTSPGPTSPQAPQPSASPAPSDPVEVSAIVTGEATSQATTAPPQSLPEAEALLVAAKAALSERQSAYDSINRLLDTTKLDLNGLLTDKELEAWATSQRNDAKVETRKLANTLRDGVEPQLRQYVQPMGWQKIKGATTVPQQSLPDEALVLKTGDALLKDMGEVQRALEAAGRDGYVLQRFATPQAARDELARALTGMTPTMRRTTEAVNLFANEIWQLRPPAGFKAADIMLPLADRIIKAVGSGMLLRPEFTKFLLDQPKYHTRILETLGALALQPDSRERTRAFHEATMTYLVALQPFLPTTVLKDVTKDLVKLGLSTSTDFGEQLTSGSLAVNGVLPIPTPAKVTEARRHWEPYWQALSSTLQRIENEHAAALDLSIETSMKRLKKDLSTFQSLEEQRKRLFHQLNAAHQAVQEAERYLAQLKQQLAASPSPTPSATPVPAETPAATDPEPASSGVLVDTASTIGAAIMTAKLQEYERSREGSTAPALENLLPAIDNLIAYGLQEARMPSPSGGLPPNSAAYYLFLNPDVQSAILPSQSGTGPNRHPAPAVGLPGMQLMDSLIQGNQHLRSAISQFADTVNQGIIANMAGGGQIFQPATLQVGSLSVPPPVLMANGRQITVTSPNGRTTSFTLPAGVSMPTGGILGTQVPIVGPAVPPPPRSGGGGGGGGPISATLPINVSGSVSRGSDSASEATWNTL